MVFFGLYCSREWVAGNSRLKVEAEKWATAMSATKSLQSLCGLKENKGLVEWILRMP
jgi:hypothetical protein